MFNIEPEGRHERRTYPEERARITVTRQIRHPSCAYSWITGYLTVLSMFLAVVILCRKICSCRALSFNGVLSVLSKLSRSSSDATVKVMYARSNSATSSLLLTDRCFGRLMAQRFHASSSFSLTVSCQTPSLSFKRMTVYFRALLFF